MTKNIEIVRKYIENSEYHDSAWDHKAALALTAHKQEVAALVEALKDAVCALEVCGKNYDYVMDKARAALRPFTGDEK